MSGSPVGISNLTTSSCDKLSSSITIARKNFHERRRRLFSPFSRLGDDLSLEIGKCAARKSSLKTLPFWRSCIEAPAPDLHLLSAKFFRHFRFVQPLQLAIHPLIESIRAIIRHYPFQRFCCGYGPTFPASLRGGVKRRGSFRFMLMKARTESSGPNEW